MKKLFHYSVDVDTAEVSPIAIITTRRGGVLHIPANALTVEPLPQKTGFAVVAKADLSGTEYIKDFRNRTIYNTSDATQSKVVVTLGDIETGWTLIKPPLFSIWNNHTWVQNLELLQQAQNAQVNAWRDNEEMKPDQIVTVDSIEWDANPASRKRIESTLASSFTPPFWTDANDVDQQITREQLQAIHTAIVHLGFTIHARQREMKAEITTLTTCDAVNNYLIGWPSSAN